MPHSANTVREVCHVTTRCNVCGTERQEIQGTKDRVLVCCGVEVNPYRVRVVSELSDGRAVETIIEDDQPTTTRWVGHNDG